MVLGVFGCDFGFRRELGWYGGAARGMGGVWKCRMVYGGGWWLRQGWGVAGLYGGVAARGSQGDGGCGKVGK
ncbi:hypothetical protein ACFX2B_022590 [Malus domestica]